jgi:hypothetical protein
MPRTSIQKNKNLGFASSIPTGIYEELWHVWTVTIPRRSITGRLVWGTVLRRRDDGRWIYKKYFADEVSRQRGEPAPEK